ncbi:uncharacterized protein LOC144112681 [Amblyomma americanum]
MWLCCRWVSDPRAYIPANPHYHQPHHQVKTPPVEPRFVGPPKPEPQEVPAAAAAGPPGLDAGTGFSCDLCGKVFVSRQALLSHGRRSHGIRRFVCTHCGAAFQQSGHLSKHTRTHTGERPFPCQICQSRFTQKVHLVEHMRTHTGERPYRCHICQATFSRKAHLVGHTRTHTGERPFQCPDCPKAFATSSAVNQHRRVTHRSPENDNDSARPLL